MDEELKAMLEGAKAQGANDTDLGKIIDMYEADASKKKGGSKPTSTPQKSVSETPIGSSGGVKPAFKNTVPSYLPDFNSVWKEKKAVEKPKKFRLPNESDEVEMQRRGITPPPSEILKQTANNTKELYDLDANGNVIPEKPNKLFAGLKKQDKTKGFYQQGEELVKQNKDIQNGFSEKTTFELEGGKLIPKTTVKDFKTSEGIDKEIENNDLNLDHPYLYYSTFDKENQPKDTFVESNFGENKLADLGINTADFDGFLNKKGYKAEFLEKEANGLFEGKGADLTGGYNIQLAKEIQKQRLLNLYMQDINSRDFAKRKLNQEKVNLGKLRADREQLNTQYTLFDANKVGAFYEKEMPILTQKLKERDVENKKIYDTHKNGDAGFFYGTKQVLNSGWNGFIDRVNQTSSTMLDKIGLDSGADELRLLNEERQVQRPNTRDVGYASGRTTTYDGVDYLVTNDGQIIDKDKKIRVTDLFFKPTYDAIVNKSKSGAEDSVFSFQGSAIQAGGVLGDMIVQVALQRGIGLASGSTVKAGSLLSKIPISKSIGSAIIAQSALGYSQGLEQTYKSAIDAGIDEKTAKVLATDAAQRMAGLYAVTAPISPQTKAIEGIFGSEGKELIKKAIAAYTQTGKKGFIETFKQGGKQLSKNAIVFTEEGGKEVFQENIQQSGESYGVNSSINREAGRELLKETISGDEFVNTSILSFASGGLMTLPGMFSSTDKLKTLQQLSKDPLVFEKNLKELVSKGVFTNDKADILRKDVKIYSNQAHKIPKNLNKDIAMDVMSDLEDISQLEVKKKGIDKSFHEEIDAEIEAKRTGIRDRINFVGLSKKEIATLKETASDELIAEAKEQGKKEFKFDNKQITERANKIYAKQVKENKKKENEQTPTTPEAQPQSEVPQQAEAEKVDELRESTKISQNQEVSPVEDVVATSSNEPIVYKVTALLPKKFNADSNNTLMTESELELLDAKAEKIIENPREDVSDRVRIQQGNAFTIQDLDAIEQFFKARREGIETRSFSDWRKNTTLENNEATPETNTPTNGNVQLGASNVGESGNAKPKSNSKSSVQSSVDGGEVKGEVEVEKKSVTLPSLDDIADFINQTYLKDEQPKPTAEGDAGAKKRSPKKNIDSPESAGKSKTKEVVLDENGFVIVSKKGKTPLEKRKFKGDRKEAVSITPSDARSVVLSFFAKGGKIASSYFTKPGELKARNNGINGIATTKAKDIDSIAHDLWQSQENKVLKLDTEAYKEAIEEVVRSHNNIQDVVDSLLKYGEKEIQESPKERQENFQAYNELQAEEKASDEEMQKALNVLDQLSEAEIIELTNDKEKGFEEYLKDLEERQVTYDLGPFSERGTLQSDGSIISENGDYVSKESVTNVTQVNPKIQAKKEISKDSPELKEVDAKLVKANEKLRIAKDALDRKAKSLDKELLKDNEDIFGERKNQNENKLFDERVDGNARNKATEKERKAITDAQNEIKSLKEAKAKIENGEIVSTKEMVFAEVDRIAQQVKDLLPGIKDPDLKVQGFSQDQLIDLIATAVKKLISASIDVNEAITQVVDSIKAKFGDIDIDIDAVKEKINPKVEEEKKADNDFKTKSGKKSLLGRLIQGGNPDVITKAVKELGENYDVRNQQEANDEAMAFIDKVGASEALKAIKDGLITNSDVKMLIYDEALTRLKTEISDEINNNPEDREALIQKFQEVSDDFDKAIRDAGQGIAIMNYIYNKNQTLKYNLKKQISDWKRNDPNGEIPADVKAKFEELEQKLKDVEERTKVAEERAKKAEDDLAIKNIKEDVERKNQASRKNKSGLTPQEQNRKKELRNKFARANDVTGIPALLVDPEFREYLGLVLKTAKGDFSNFSNEILKELGKSARQHLPELFANAGGKGDVKVTDLQSITINEEGKIKIPAQMLRDYVEQGYTDIDEIAALIKDDIADEFPDADVRDIRDALTGYGKQINPNKDEITAEVNKLKEYGRLLSAYDDVMNGQMPLKSGLKRPKSEQKARELRRNINRLAKELNLEPIDLEKQWANAIDKVKSHLKNQIEDLDKQIANGEKRKVERTSIKLDEEATALKTIRDAKKQILDDLVGKPELTEEQKIASAEKSLETSIKKIQEEIDTNDISFKEKPTPATSKKIEELRTAKKALLETKKQLRQEAGLIEQQRLKTTKTRIKNQIEDLNTRIKNKDFAKKEVKPILADNELNTLRAEKEAIYEEYEKMKYLQELKNRSRAKKIMDEGLEALGLARAVKASLDLGLIGIQLRGFTYSELWRNPKELGRKFIKLFGAIGSQNKTNKAMSELIGHPLHALAKKLDIGMTHPDLRNEVREEMASGNLLHFIWSSPVLAAEALGGKEAMNSKRASIGDSFIDSVTKQYNKLFKNYQVDIKQKEKFSIKEQWKNINAFEAVERGLSIYGNQLRFEEFVRGVERLKAEGKDEINHLEDYKLLASYIRTFSGRAKPAGFELNQKALNVFFFSFKNMASVMQQLNPIYYGLQHTNSTDFKNGNYFKPSVANKMAMATMFKSVVSTSATILFIMASYNAFKDDDEEEATLETDPRSSDFGKIKIGNFRADFWGGYIPLISLYARLLTEETKKSDGTIVKFGEGYGGIESRGDAATKFLINKESPGFQIFHKYMTSTEEVDKATGETYRVTPFGGKLSEEDAYSFYPMFIGSVKQAKEKDYEGVQAFLTAYSILGLGNVQEYEQSKSKTKGGMFKMPGLEQKKFKLPKL